MYCIKFENGVTRGILPEEYRIKEVAEFNCKLEKERHPGIYHWVEEVTGE